MYPSSTGGPSPVDSLNYQLSHEQSECENVEYLVVALVVSSKTASKLSIYHPQG